MHFMCVMYSVYSVMDFQLSSIAYKAEISATQQFQSTIEHSYYMGA